MGLGMEAGQQLEDAGNPMGAMGGGRFRALQTATEPEAPTSSFDPAQTQMLEEYYQAPLDERPYSPDEQQRADMLQQQYMQAQQQQPQETASQPPVTSPADSEPPFTADLLEQQIQLEQKNGTPRYDSGTRSTKIQLARMFEQQGMDPVTAMGQAVGIYDDLWQHYRSPHGVAQAVRQMTMGAWEQQQAQQQQMQQQGQSQAVASQQNDIRQKAAPSSSQQ